MNFDGRKSCDPCKGFGRVLGEGDWPLCASCGGIGKVFELGGPAFGCEITLADRIPGEIVTLGTGAKVKILWHMSRDEPETTFVSVIADFDDTEDPQPRAVSSSMGVRRVDRARQSSKKGEGGTGTKHIDASDPLSKDRGNDLI